MHEHPIFNPHCLPAAGLDAFLDRAAGTPAGTPVQFPASVRESWTQLDRQWRRLSDRAGNLAIPGAAPDPEAIHAQAQRLDHIAGHAYRALLSLWPNMQSRDHVRRTHSGEATETARIASLDEGLALIALEIAEVLRTSRSDNPSPPAQRLALIRVVVACYRTFAEVLEPLLGPAPPAAAEPITFIPPRTEIPALAVARWQCIEDAAQALLYDDCPEARAALESALKLDAKEVREREIPY